MRQILDLGELCKQLHQTEEHEPQFDEDLNPYLFHTVLPQLEGENPIRLEQIDFDQFDEDDPITILRHFYWHEKLCEEMCRINSRVAAAPPACTGHRAFL